MTKPEITGVRDLTFNQWIKDNLPDSSTGLMVTDIDFVLYNYKTKRLMILEVKTRNKIIETWQEILYKNFHKWLKTGVDSGWEYRGAYLIRFENTSFKDGRCYITSFEKNITKQVSEQGLMKFLSMEYQHDR